MSTAPKYGWSLEGRDVGILKPPEVAVTTAIGVDLHTGIETEEHES